MCMVYKQLSSVISNYGQKNPNTIKLLTDNVRIVNRNLLVAQLTHHITNLLGMKYKGDAA